MGRGFRSLSMEMETLYGRCPVSSMSEMREEEAEKRAKARSLPSYRCSLALDHLLRIGGKQILHRWLCLFPFLS
jgi:hypothetical protein